MAQIVVVADDLTGSNATGALFARLGLHTVTVSDLGQVPRYADAVDVLVVNTGSRRFTPAESYDAVHAAMTAATAGGVLVVKRVDTTLRGNPGRELDAVVDAFTARGAICDVTCDATSNVTQDAARGAANSAASASAPGTASAPATARGAAESASVHAAHAASGAPTPVRVLAVPAFPDAGRTTVGGIHLVDGVPLTRTAAAQDLFSPVRHARVASVIGEQSALSTGEVPLDVVEDGVDAVLEALRGPGADVMVCDATENGHLRTVAAAAARLSAEDGTRWISLDSGPFGAALAAELGVRPSGEAPRILAVVGSTTDATHEQLARTEKALGAHYAVVDPDEAEAEPPRIVRELRAAADSGTSVLGVRVAPSAAGDPGAAERILRCLAEVAVHAVDVLDPGGLYTSGGDVTAAVTGALGAEGFAIEAEVLPLAVAGHLVGGPHSGLPFATKGGLIGGPDAAVACLERLRAMNSRGVASSSGAGSCGPRAASGNSGLTSGTSGAVGVPGAGDGSAPDSAPDSNHRRGEEVSP
ncbi:four-carbon acid sugar kinase family protein [Streptomyces marispadix]|uniref:Four-carbon acid sugar kinase family protein n=1 Tax=Streptomyces marispadix TaxID=2922868 RepID=A0ABS9T347_9ACTN|nr:four-carbon acid sugar kinase family protein [Streptomyces marispadix]MCH6162937.1 four-carbon acid sugar kinase family protein [Streptomyces marispadix]